MEKNYSMEEILKLFYEQVLLKNNPNITEIIDKNSEFISNHQKEIDGIKQYFAREEEKSGFTIYLYCK